MSLVATRKVVYCGLGTLASVVVEVSGTWRSALMRLPMSFGSPHRNHGRILYGLFHSEFPRTARNISDILPAFLFEAPGCVLLEAVRKRSDLPCLMTLYLVCADIAAGPSRCLSVDDLVVL